MTATPAPHPELVYTSFPIEKMEQEGDTLYVRTSYNAGPGQRRAGGRLIVERVCA